MSKKIKDVSKEEREIMPQSQRIQNNIWRRLTDKGMPPIASRYVARKFQAKGITRIVEVQQNLSSVYSVRGNNGRLYHISLHPIDIPAAEIKESDI